MMTLQELLLAHLAEEHNEVTVEASSISKLLMKSQRYGLQSWYKGESNADRINKAMLDYVDEFVDTQLIMLLLLEINPTDPKGPHSQLLKPASAVAMIRAHRHDMWIRLRLERLLGGYDAAYKANKLSLGDLADLYQAVASLLRNFGITDPQWLDKSLGLPYPTD